MQSEQCSHQTRQHQWVKTRVSVLECAMQQADIYVEMTKLEFPNDEGMPKHK